MLLVRRKRKNKNFSPYINNEYEREVGKKAQRRNAVSQTPLLLKGSWATPINRQIEAGFYSRACSHDSIRMDAASMHRLIVSTRGATSHKVK